MFRKSIKQKIIGIAAGLIVLAVITSILSMVLAGRVGHLLDELTNKYIPAYGHLARVNVRSLERSLALRRMMGARMMQTTPDPAAYGAMATRITKDLGVQLILEPGRLIAANAGVLVSRVIYIKKGENKTGAEKH